MGRWQPCYWLFKLGHLHRPLIYLYSLVSVSVYSNWNLSDNIAIGTRDSVYWVQNLSYQLKLFQIDFSQKNNSSCRLNTLGWLCLPAAYRGLHMYNVWYRNGNTAQFTFMNILERYSSVCFTISFPRLMQYIANPFILSIKKNDSLHVCRSILDINFIIQTQFHFFDQ